MCYTTVEVLIYSGTLSFPRGTICSVVRVGIDCVMEGDDDGTCCDGVCVLDGIDGIVVDLVGVDVIACVVKGGMNPGAQDPVPNISNIKVRLQILFYFINGVYKHR